MLTLRSLRHLKRSPASAAAAVLTIAATLGAGGTLFALFEAVVLTPPPFADSDSLVVLGELPAEAGSGPPRAVPVGTFLEWQARRDGLTRLEAYDATNVTLSRDGPARRLSATSATSGLLDMLGVTPALGRLWTTDEAASRVVVVSHQFWQGQLLGDSAVIGVRHLQASRSRSHRSDRGTCVRGARR